MSTSDPTRPHGTGPDGDAEPGGTGSPDGTGTAGTAPGAATPETPATASVADPDGTAAATRSPFAPPAPSAPSGPILDSPGDTPLADEVAAVRGTPAHVVDRPIPLPPPETPGPAASSAVPPLTPASGPPDTPGDATPIPTATGTPPVRRSSADLLAAPLTAGTADGPPTGIAPGTDAAADDDVAAPGSLPAAVVTPVAGDAAPTGTTPTDTAVLTPATATAPSAADQPATHVPRAAVVPLPPRRAGAWTHVLGAVVGVLLTPLAVVGVLIGQARILAVQAPAWDGSFDAVGVVLVTLGGLALALVLLLGLWTPAVPIAGGLLATLVGAVYLYVPATLHPETVRWFATDSTRGTVTEATVAATSGTVFLVGVVLLVAGLVTVVARRAGVRLGQFRGIG
ncbi:hypothetical protein AGMMS50218_16430 [Actinomycetota bacterium]|nr:hypothetical protein AGMMS50218_16430 [Actinomycetota bacterium]